MNTLRSLAATAIIASALTGPIAFAAPNTTCYFNACGPKTAASTPARTAPSGTAYKTIGEHGSWIAVTDGDVIMIMDRFQDGAKFAIADANDKIAVMVSAPGWNLRKGETVTMRVVIDGEGYTGKAVAEDGKTLFVEGLSKEFVNALYNGTKARVSVGDDTFDLSLRDASATIDDVILFQKTASR